MEMNRNMLMMTPREEADQQRLHLQNPQALNGLFVGIYTSKTFLSGGAGTWQIRSKKVDDETEKRLHFHNPPALDQKTATAQNYPDVPLHKTT